MWQVFKYRVISGPYFPVFGLNTERYALLEKCPNTELFLLHIFLYLNWIQRDSPNTELFLVHILLYSNWIRRDTPYLSVFSPNTGKYGPEITPYLNTCHVVSNYKKNACYESQCPLKLALTKPSYWWYKKSGLIVK